jgi:hypothetical protein
MDTPRIEKKELKFALIGIAVIILWMSQVRFWIEPSLQNLPPFLAMLLFNTGFVVGMFLLSSVLNGGIRKIKITMLAIIVPLMYDLFQPTWLVSTKGVVNKAVEYWFVTPDAGFASLWSAIGIHGTLLYIFVYYVTPILLLFVFPVIFTDAGAIFRAMRKGE